MKNESKFMSLKETLAQAKVEQKKNLNEISMRAFERANEEYKGYCSNCKKFTRPNTEPDARKYDCPKCKKNTVYGAEEALMMGLISLSEGRNTRKYGEEPIDAKAFTVEENPMPESRFAESKRRRSPVLKEGELSSAMRTIGSIRDAYLIKNPAGTWSFVGRVPAELMYERIDGEPLSEKDIDSIRNFGAGVMRNSIKSRVYQSPHDAIEAAKPLDILIRGAGKDIIYDPSTGEVDETAVEHLSESKKPRGRKLNEDARPRPEPDENGEYPAYAWPGGYPVYYIMKDNGVLCPDCVNNERPKHLDDEYPDDDQWIVAGQDINYEDADLYCDHCNEKIECAYCEDEDNEEENEEIEMENRNIKGRKLNEEREIKFRSLNEMWSGPLQDEYTDFEEFETYDEMYNLSGRLGFDSAEEAWEANPVVKGSTDPNDYGLESEEDLPDINEIESEGSLVDEYPVDESQTVSNAGDAKVYAYMNHMWEIITWNDEAEEHESGSQTVNDLGVQYDETTREGKRLRGIDEAMEVGEDGQLIEKEDSIDDKIKNASISELARMIRRDWKKVYFGASPYLSAMSSMESIDSSYGMDDGRSVVNYFLANATQWKGELARKIKKELNNRVRGRSGGSTPRSNDKEFEIFGMKFKAVRKTSPVPHWRAELPNGKLAGYWLHGETKAELWRRLERDAKAVGEERFKKGIEDEMNESVRAHGRKLNERINKSTTGDITMKKADLREKLLERLENTTEGRKLLREVEESKNPRNRRGRKLNESEDDEYFGDEGQDRESYSDTQDRESYSEGKMINNFEDLCKQFGCESKAQIEKAVYELTECGAWIKFTKDGVELGSIVEGSDAEVGPESLTYPFSIGEIWNTLEGIDNEACALWDEANEGVQMESRNRRGHKLNESMAWETTDEDIDQACDELGIECSEEIYDFIDRDRVEDAVLNYDEFDDQVSAMQEDLIAQLREGGYASDSELDEACEGMDECGGVQMESRNRRGRKLNENHTGAALRSGVPIIGGVDYRSSTAKRRSSYEVTDEMLGGVVDQYGGIRLTNDDIFAEGSYEKNMSDHVGGMFDDEDFIIDMNRLRKPKSSSKSSSPKPLHEAKFDGFRKEEETSEEEFDADMDRYYIDDYDPEGKENEVIDGPGRLYRIRYRRIRRIRIRCRKSDGSHQPKEQKTRGQKASSRKRA
jgi:hypothetical protein